MRSRTRAFSFGIGLIAIGTVAAAAQVSRTPDPAPTVAPTATDTREPIRVDYTGPVECSDSVSFLNAVMSKTTHVRPAAPRELARLVRVSITASPSPDRLIGEVGLLRIGDQAPVRLTTTGACENVVGTLVQFAALSVDSSVTFAPVEAALPDNPYRQWHGVLAESLPENPYRGVDSVLLQNPYRELADQASLPSNPYRVAAGTSREALPAALVNNPYRHR
jgi:hypothetical protein